MKYKLGQEIFIKAQIADIDSISKEYFVTLNPNSINWVSEDKIIPMDKTYEMGLSDAWELAKKIYLAPCDGGLEQKKIDKIFGCSWARVMTQYTAAEALAKIEAYEKEKEIKVGDIVTIDSVKGMAVVTNVGEGSVNVMWDDGIAGNCETNRLKKTNKHIDIESLLKEIGE